MDAPIVTSRTGIDGDRCCRIWGPRVRSASPPDLPRDSTSSRRMRSGLSTLVDGTSTTTTACGRLVAYQGFRRQGERAGLDRGARRRKARRILRANDGAVMTAAWEQDVADGAWRGWWPITDGVTVPGGWVTAVARAPHKLDVFMVGQDGGVYTAAWGIQRRAWRVARLVAHQGPRGHTGIICRGGFAPPRQTGCLRGSHRRCDSQRRVGSERRERRLARMVVRCRRSDDARCACHSPLACP